MEVPKNKVQIIKSMNICDVSQLLLSFSKQDYSVALIKIIIIF